jgi:hypothetical protein
VATASKQIAVSSNEKNVKTILEGPISGAALYKKGIYLMNIGLLEPSLALSSF